MEQESSAGQDQGAAFVDTRPTRLNMDHKPFEVKRRKRRQRPKSTASDGSPRSSRGSRPTSAKTKPRSPAELAEIARKTQLKKDRPLLLDIYYHYPLDGEMIREGIVYISQT